MDKTVAEPAREIPLMAEPDVLVVGGGPAGLGAALGAAWSGANTLLVERGGCLGGMMTLGEVRNIRTFNDGKKQIIGGAGDHLIQRLIDAGGTRQTPDKGPFVRQEPEIMKFVAQEAMLDAGVEILLHAMMVDALVEDNRVTGVIVESKSGRQAIRAGATIDATGDADVVAHSGATFEKSDELQPMTLALTLAGIATWPTIVTPELHAQVKAAIEDGSFPTLTGPGLFPLESPEGVAYANTTRVIGSCIDVWDLTRAEIEARRQAMKLIEWYRNHAPGFENVRLERTAPEIGTRESRRLTGLYAMTREDILDGRRNDDDIALGAYGIDIHYNGPGSEMTWLEKGQPYGIPYRTLVPESMDGLLAAGRCISATRDALGSLRVMATGMATGHAAGTAAALAVARNKTPRDLSIDALRDTLREQNAILD